MCEPVPIYRQLERHLATKLHPAPDDWDGRYGLDFHVDVNGKYIGIHIRFETLEHVAEAFKRWFRRAQTHRRFTRQFGGKVFMVLSVTGEVKTKAIYNKDSVIAQIGAEIQRLRRLPERYAVGWSRR